MVKYECSVGCGMGVEGLKCSECGSDLQHGSLAKDDGTSVAISECPQGCGKIKSPTCCGEDMHSI